MLIDFHMRGIPKIERIVPTTVRIIDIALIDGASNSILITQI
jgi:hypothetical protein